MVKVRALYISDVHIGVSENNVSDAITVLNEYDFDYLFLVGDIIDVKELRKKWRWKDLDTKFLELVISKGKKSKVVYISGNHERGIFDNPPDFGWPIHFCREFKFEDKLIVHGDQFDTIIGTWKFIYSLGDWGYNLSIRLNYWINSIRKLFLSNGEIRLSKHLKKIVKHSINYLSDFHEAAVQYAKYNNCRIVICGHTHQPEVRQIGNTIYANCGDFRQDKTFIIEHHNGDLELLDLEKPDERILFGRRPQPQC